MGSTPPADLGQLRADASRFQAEVISGVVAPGRTNALELKIRFIQGKLARGTAQLVAPSGDVRTITILGITQVHYTHPSAIEPNIMYIGATDVAPDIIHAGQMIVQPKE